MSFLFFIILPAVILSQAFILYCCAALGRHRSEGEYPALEAYEDAAQAAYIREWNDKHRKHK